MAAESRPHHTPACAHHPLPAPPRRPSRTGRPGCPDPPQRSWTSTRAVLALLAGTRADRRRDRAPTATSNWSSRRSDCADPIGALVGIDAKVRGRPTASSPAAGSTTSSRRAAPTVGGALSSSGPASATSSTASGGAVSYAHVQGQRRRWMTVPRVGRVTTKAGAPLGWLPPLTVPIGVLWATWWLERSVTPWTVGSPRGPTPPHRTQTSGGGPDRERWESRLRPRQIQSLPAAFAAEWCWDDPGDGIVATGGGGLVEPVAPTRRRGWMPACSRVDAHGSPPLARPRGSLLMAPGTGQ